MAIWEVLNNKAGNISRYYRRNEATTDYATIPEVTLAGDFVIEFDVLSDNDDNAYMILGNNGGTQNCIFITNNDISVRDNSGSTVFSNGDYLQPLEVHSVKITKIDGVVEIFIDGVSRGGGASSSSYIFNMLYTRQAGVFILPGILANLKIWDNGTLIRDYPLDDNSDILRNRATVLGGELWNGVDAVAVGTEEVVATTIVGVDYLVTVSGLTSGEDLRYAGAGWLPLQDGVPFVITATSTAFILREFSESQSDITISIRRADGYGTVISGNADDWGLFQQQVTGEWLGQELLSQPFNPADWVVANAATYNGIVNNLHEYTFPASVSQDYVQQSVTNGLNYRATIDSQYISGIDSLRVKFGATRPFISPVSGINVVNELQNGTDFGFGAQSPDGPRTVGIKSISLKEVLNVA